MGPENGCRWKTCAERKMPFTRGSPTKRCQSPASCGTTATRCTGVCAARRDSSWKGRGVPASGGTGKMFGTTATMAGSDKIPSRGGDTGRTRLPSQVALEGRRVAAKIGLGSPAVVVLEPDDVVDLGARDLAQL